MLTAGSQTYQHDYNYITLPSFPLLCYTLCLDLILPVAQFFLHWGSISIIKTLSRLIPTLNEVTEVVDGSFSFQMFINFNTAPKTARPKNAANLS